MIVFYTVCTANSKVSVSFKYYDYNMLATNSKDDRWKHQTLKNKQQTTRRQCKPESTNLNDSHGTTVGSPYFETTAINKRTQPIVKISKQNGLSRDKRIQQRRNGGEDNLTSKTTTNRNSLLPRQTQYYSFDNKTEDNSSNLVVHLSPRQQASTACLLNPSRDPRFQRLVAQLVPNKEKITIDVIPVHHGNDRYRQKDKEVMYFHDVCLEGTCRIIYKMMKIGYNN